VIDSEPSGIRAWLSNLALFGIKLGLDAMRAISQALGTPEREWKAVHIAGTNGKGSVAALTAHALQSAGHSTGRYTSPHLVRLEERIVINGRPVAEAALDHSLTRVRDAVESLRRRGVLEGHPTFFEVTTAAAFDAFRTAGVEFGVIEVGLGGRFDATNVLQPIATAITTIDFDHEQHLGSTLRQIAFEKAGILKPGAPAVVGQMADEARHEVARVAVEQGAPLIDAAAGSSVAATRRSGSTELTLTTPIRRYGPLTMSLRGAHQIPNALVAVRLVETVESLGVAVGAPAVESALREARWPARLDLRTLPDGRQVLIDGAHNPSGAAALAAYIAEEWPTGLPIVFGAMADKDLPRMLNAIGPRAHPLVLTAAPGKRAADPRDLDRIARDAGIVSIVEPSLRRAMETAWAHGPIIAVAGSLYLAGAVMKELDLAV